MCVLCLPSLERKEKPNTNNISKKIYRNYLFNPRERKTMSLVCLALTEWLHLPLKSLLHVYISNEAKLFSEGET